MGYFSNIYQAAAGDQVDQRARHLIDARATKKANPAYPEYWGVCGSPHERRIIDLHRGVGTRAGDVLKAAFLSWQPRDMPEKLDS